MEVGTKEQGHCHSRPWVLGFGYERLRDALVSIRSSAHGQDDGWILDAVDEALK